MIVIGWPRWWRFPTAAYYLETLGVFEELADRVVDDRVSEVVAR